MYSIDQRSHEWVYLCESEMLVSDTMYCVTAIFLFGLLRVHMPIIVYFNPFMIFPFKIQQVFSNVSN